MKTLIKWAFRLFILVIVLVVSAILLMDTAFKALAERRIKDQTGLDVKIGKFEISFLNRKMVIENLVIYNSAEFGGSPMVNMPELFLQMEPEALQARRLHFKLARFNLAELNYVQGVDGKNNFDELMVRMEERQKKAAKEGKKSLDQTFEFDGIDILNLSLGKFRMTYLKNPAKSQEFDLRIKNEIITGIKTQEDLQAKLAPILVKSGTTIFQELVLGGSPAVPPAVPASATPPAPPQRIIR